MEFLYELRPDHLRVIARGAFDPRHARVELGNILRQSEGSGHARILVDAREISTQVSIADRYELATSLADMAPASVRIAFLVAPGNLYTKTLEDTALNRGLKVRTTDSPEEAREYLGLSAG